MLFNKNGFREFFAMQSNGTKIRIAYEVGERGESVPREVGGLSTVEYPLPDQYKIIVVGWCDEHRATLHTHDDYRSAA